MLRYMGSTCALLYGLFLGYIAVSQSIAYGLRFDIRFSVAAIAVVGGSVGLAGASIRYTAAAMGLVLLWESQFMAHDLPAIVEGVWQYSWLDVPSFVLMALTVLGIIFSLLADKGIQVILTRARHWPHEEF